MHQNPWSVSQLTKYIKSLLDNDWRLQEVWVKGEISNFTHHSSGHMYFSIKDDKSVVRSIMFAGNNRSLIFVPKNGMRILLRGYISLYERDGQYQLYVQEMLPDGIGNLYMAYQQLKEKLQNQGYFAEAHKKGIPFLPKGIAILTSATGAAIRDILTTLRRRNPGIPCYVVPVTVQGKTAAAEIADALQFVDTNCQDFVDVIILARGGGSIEELWAFNEEILAKRIYECSIPVITGIGHETDTTIADFVADMRAATPTAAAELAAPSLTDLQKTVVENRQRMIGGIEQRMRRYRQQLDFIAQTRVFRRPEELFAGKRQSVDHYQQTLAYCYGSIIERERKKLHRAEQQLICYNPREQFTSSKHRFLSLVEAMQRMSARHLSDNRGRFHLVNQRLHDLSPLKVMERGYSLVYKEQAAESGEENHPLITSVRQVKPEDCLHIQLADGTVDCQVRRVADGKKK